MKFSMAACLAAIVTLALGPRAAAAQDGPPPVDSILVEGNARVATEAIVAATGLRAGQSANYRDIQRAITALYKSGEFDDVTVEQRGQEDRKLYLVFLVKERPILDGVELRGSQNYRRTLAGGQRAVTEECVSLGGKSGCSTALDVSGALSKVERRIGQAVPRAEVEEARFTIDSLYKKNGFFAARVKLELQPQENGALRAVYELDAGGKVAIAQVQIEGNERFTDAQVVGAMASKPEGFWWYRKGEYSEAKIQQDVRENLPGFYAANGHIDFQVLADSLVPDSTTGKAILKLTVAEGPRYRVGKFDLSGNRRFSNAELGTLFPFGTMTQDGQLQVDSTRPFDRAAWQSATEKLRDLYANNGYIYSQVEPEEVRRTGADGEPVVDLRWIVREGQPATVNKIIIVGNEVTHERVIREAIVLFPGQVFNKDALIRSYQNVSNLGYFNQPMPAPDVQPSENKVDVDVIFRVEEKRTGNINFGASLGQGTGVGGFLGLEEPNLFGKGKRGRLQWQFGANINDFNLSYTDPAIKESRISGTVSLFDSRARFVVGDLGRRRSTGFNLQVGFPFLGSRYTRIFASYGLSRQRFSEGSADLQAAFNCPSCTRSTLGLNLLRDTRIGLPFATAGTYTSLNTELNGGFLGGTGDYRKVEFDGRYYAPLGALGGNGQLGGGVQFTLGVTAKTGFVFGDAGPFFPELYSLGGVQFGIPLRGYPEFSITPDGYDPQANTGQASPTAFGGAYSAFTVEAGARVSQALYVSSFFDAGNVYRTSRQWNPTRLFRGAGFGAAIVSPLGPIGVDLAYGFDRVDANGSPAPGWQLHFRLGNFF